MRKKRLLWPSYPALLGCGKTFQRELGSVEVRDFFYKAQMNFLASRVLGCRNNT